MTTSTMNLPKKSIDWLQDLIQVNIDSRDGFQDAAENLKGKNPLIESLFRSMAADRSRQAVELREIVAANAEEPEDSGSMTAAAHRTWMDLRTALGGGEQAVLSEAERGEDHIKGKYESALRDLAGCVCASTLQKQYVSVKASHDKVKALRDQNAAR